MEYTKPDLVLIGRAETLVLGGGNKPGDPAGHTSSVFGDLEFED